MTISPAPDIFISHATLDDVAVSTPAARCAAGFGVWVDHEGGIPIGTPAFDRRIRAALSACQRGLLVLTAACKSRPGL